MTTPGSPPSPERRPVDRLQARVRDLLEDAREARRSGDARLVTSLAHAVLALDPGNAEAEALLVGGATRRQMTLLFCDLVDSTATADALDPEEVTALLHAFRSTCQEVVDEYDGYIDDHRGDGMLVLFGYPRVNEDDARRGVSCGLRIIERLRRRADSLGGVAAERLRVRVAVHTDLVVVGDLRVSGATSNEAARLQQVAEPDMLVISDTTYDLVAPWFRTASLGSRQLRGVTRPIPVYRVDGEVRAGDGPAIQPGPFVGRRRELDQLLAFGSGRQPGRRAMLVSGPPGLGKTRLLAEAGHRLGPRVVRANCSRLHQNVSLHPLRDALEQACGIKPADPAADRLAKLRRHAAGSLPSGQDLPFLAAALDIPLGLLNPPPDVDPGHLRQLALGAAAGLLADPAAQPLLLIVDDMHWADQGTLDLLGALLGQPSGGLRLLLAARDGFVPPWPAELVEVLPLAPLSHGDLFELAQRLPEGAELSEAERAASVARSDGVPLYLEELLRTTRLLAEGRLAHRSLRFSDYKIPPVLRDPLLARLSVPEVDLGLVQLAATLGREVDLGLLAALAGPDAGQAQSFDDRISSLVAAGLLEYDGDHARFRHELIREVAYESQGRQMLRERHGLIADQLLAAGPELNHGQLEELAFHLERSRRYDEAVVTQLQIAGLDQAVGSHAEVTRRLTEVLTLLGQLSGERRDELELTVRELRSFSAVMAGGYAAPEAAEDYPRCVALAETVRPHEAGSQMIRSWSFYAFRGDLDEADAATESLASRVAAAGLDLPVRQMGYGMVNFFRGDVALARRQLADFVDTGWGATPGTPPPGWPLPNDAVAAVMAHLIPLAWIAGEPDEAEEWSERALDRAAGLTFPYGPFSTLYVQSLRAVTAGLAGDIAGAMTIGSEMVSLGEHHGFAIWRLAGSLQGLLGAVQLGQLELLEPLTQAVGAWRGALAANVWTPYWLTGLGQAQQAVGLTAAAVDSFTEALAVADRTRSRFDLPETLRGRGAARLALGDQGGRDDLAAALVLAREQGAPVFEQRAAAAYAAAGLAEPEA